VQLELSEVDKVKEKSCTFYGLPHHSRYFNVMHHKGKDRSAPDYFIRTFTEKILSLLYLTLQLNALHMLLVIIANPYHL